MAKEIFRVGDRVFDIRYGWGEIVSINSDRAYPITAVFNGSKTNYTYKGESSTGNIQTLSFKEYGFDNRFSQERPINYNDYIGKWGKFWDIDVKTCIIDRLIECKPDDEYYFTTSEFGYLNFEPLTDEQIKILNLE